MLDHRTIFSLVEDKDARAYVETMQDMCYVDSVIPLGQGRSFDEWFTENEIIIENLSRQEWLDFSVLLFNTATGSKFDKHITLRKIQEAMIKIMIKLSSYSVHYIYSMIDNLTLLDWIGIRFSSNKLDMSASEIKQVQIDDIDIAYNAQGLSNTYLPMNMAGDEMDVHIYSDELYKEDVTVDIHEGLISTTDNLVIKIPTVFVSNWTETVL